jgi:membrane-associated phospholipid phosphatase
MDVCHLSTSTARSDGALLSVTRGVPSNGGETRARFGGLHPRPRRASRTACFFAHPGRTLLEAGGLLVLFTLVAQFVPAQPMALDTRWSTWMGDSQTPALKHVAVIFNALGMGYWRVVPLVAVGLLLVVARRWGALTAFALSAALTLFGSDLIKTWVDRPRPPRHIVPAKGGSFPSSHAAYAAMLAVTLILVCTEPSRRRLPWLVPVALVTACMAWSRTYLQVHWLSDAAAGVLLAIGVTLSIFSAIQLLFRRQTEVRPLRSRR